MASYQDKIAPYLQGLVYQMKKANRFLISCIFGPALAVHSHSVQELRTRLSTIADLPYICGKEPGQADLEKPGCGDKAYWALVLMKDSIIVDLLDLIDDSASIPAQVPNFGGHYAIGDAAIMVLKEIVRPFEPIRILGIKLDPMCGYCSYWNYVRKSRANRAVLESKAKKWYARKKIWMKWVEDPSFATCDCKGGHPNKGHFRIEKGK